MLKFFQNLTYIILQIILLPISLIGGIYTFNKEKIVTKRLNISYTAGQVIQGQWLMHYFNIREDNNIIKFIKKFPAESHIGFYMIFSASILAYKVSGFIPKAMTKTILYEISSYSFLFFRTNKFDQIIKKNINSVQQFVILGAGFDLRSLKFKDKNLQIFELDLKNTQDIKLATLKKSNILNETIKYVSCDLNNEDWLDKLIVNGFQQDKKTLFLFESVSCYLDKEKVEKILSKISQSCAKGSLIAQDFYSTNFLHGNEFRRVQKGKKLIEKFGERWRFTLDMTDNTNKEIDKLLINNHLSSKETYVCGERKTKSKKPFYAISLSTV